MWCPLLCCAVLAACALEPSISIGMIPLYFCQVKTVFVDGLPASWDEVRVRELLKKYGSVEKIELARNMPSARRKDYGFVTFGTHDAAVTCAKSINNEELGEGDNKVGVFSISIYLLMPAFTYQYLFFSHPCLLFIRLKCGPDYHDHFKEVKVNTYHVLLRCLRLTSKMQRFVLFAVRMDQRSIFLDFTA